MQARAEPRDWQADCRERVEAVLRRVLPAESREPARLYQAMRYAALSEGKRVRPLLVYAAGAALGVAREALAKGGSFVGKIFQGPDIEDARRALAEAFAQTRIVKPRASRSESYEIFLVGLGRRG